MTISISGVCQRTRWGWCSLLRCGQHYSTTATWAAFGICSLTDRVRMSGAWPRSRRLPGSSPPALKRPPNSVWATHAKTTGSVERAGTVMCVTAPGLVTSDAPVNEVRLCFYHLPSRVEARSFCWVCIIWIFRWEMSTMLHSDALLPNYALSWGRDGIDIKDNQKPADFNYRGYSFSVLRLKGPPFKCRLSSITRQKPACGLFI